MVEAHAIGRGCARPAQIGDLHLIHDAYALITSPHPIGSSGMTVPAFNLTSLLDTAPKVLLNVQSDDYGVIEERSCGCDARALRLHHASPRHPQLRQAGGRGRDVDRQRDAARARIRSCRRDSAERALDYQLSEEEDDKGFTRLFLCISPRVEIKDEQAK